MFYIEPDKELFEQMLEGLIPELVTELERVYKGISGLRAMTELPIVE